MQETRELRNGERTSQCARGDSVALASDSFTEWDAFAAHQPNATLYTCSGWKRVLEDAFAHIRGVFLALRDARSGEIRAGLPVYSVRSWLLGNRLVSVPFANFCDPLVNDAEDLALLLSGAKRLVVASGARGLECRPWRTTALLTRAGFELTNLYKHNYLNLENQSFDELKHKCSRTCVRQWITKGDQNGLTVRDGTDANDVNVFFALLTATRRRLGLPPIPRRFFDAIVHHLPEAHRQILLAIYRGRPAAVALVLKFNGLHALEFVGTDEALRKTGAGPWLDWQALHRAVGEKARIFSFGRTSPLNTSLLDHKRRWGTQEEDLPVCAVAYSGRPRKFVRERTLTYRLTKRIATVAPAPLYRWLGEFCYRHLG